MNSFFEEIAGDDLDPSLTNFRQMLTAGALGLKTAAGNRLIAISPTLGEAYWLDSDALAETMRVAHAVSKVQDLRSLPDGSDAVLVHRHFEALMGTLTRLAQQALLELERLGAPGLALVFASPAEASFHRLNDLRASTEQRLDELLEEIKTREKQLVRLKSLGGSNDAGPVKEPPTADEQDMP